MVSRGAHEIRDGATRYGARLAPILALLGAILVPLPAAAHSPATSSPGAVSSAGAVSAADQARLERYWTPQRRQRAVAGEVVGRGRTPAGPAPTPRRGLDAGTLPGTARPVSPSTGVRYSGGGPVAATTGVLYVTIAGSDYACSGSVVRSLSRDLVVTAGHCVHGGPGGAFAQNVVFVPGFRYGTAPYGLWAARYLTTTAAWAVRRDFEADTGFVLLNTRRGNHVQQVVGAQDIAFNAARDATQYVFGYPKLPPFNGDTLVYCAGTPTSDPYGGTSLGLRCSMTGGASGGPWLTGLGTQRPGYGAVDAVISFYYLNDPHTIYGTYFGPPQESLYRRTNEL
jgi:V8-like Glu-specific endopeptidase